MAGKLIIIGLISYFLGSFPTAFLLVRWKFHKNITQEGTGNVGTLNALRITHSRPLTVLVLLVDFLKGALAIWLASQLFGRDFEYLLAASVFVVLGHDFPVWLKFHGGRGLATSAGIFLLIQPYIVLGWLVLWLLIYLLTRKVAYANALATLLTPGILLIRAFHLYDSSTFIIVFAVTFLVFIKHIPRLLHAMRGEETVQQFQ
ncbi:glycerol-3-phosphate acyltransferase [bacterium BMS3Abin05]|nr:glycerol-3-phosphate acyltransferase [bacterium BMS3Abin05]GBE27415.1 glycerol-3-phosphate acyltransferase [bacterium BMS3Bbin03]HDL78043.1 glycerol-3-phosphate acyltransferase [Bacteroidota bacterium]HDZ12641.1 glycerol-3-phosphate acyltransferase [Bacteroidota bacterium]